MILIADDDDKNLISYQILLDNEYELLFANNGKEVIDLLSTNKLPKLIILDWKMPVMDGMETLDFLKKHAKYREIPVLIITAFMISFENMKTAYEYGVIEFIKKPISVDELKFKIRSLIDLISTNESKLINENIKVKDFEKKSLNQSILIDKIDEKLNGILSEHKTLESINYELNNIRQNITKYKNDKNQFVKNDVIENYNYDFIQALTAKHSNLTNSEIKLSSLIRMNMDTKSIATILHQTYDSVRVSRTRLRKKLKLSKDDTLISYLMQF